MKSNSLPVLARALGPNGRGAVPRALRGVACYRGILVRHGISRNRLLTIHHRTVLAHTKVKKEEITGHFFGLNFSPTYDDPLSLSYFSLAAKVAPAANPSSPCKANESSRYTVP